MARGGGVMRSSPMLALMLVAALGSTAHSASSGPSVDLDAASRAITEAGQALAAAETAPPEARAVALAGAVDAYESALVGLREAVAAASEREQTLALGFEMRRDEVMRLLAALMAISRTPPPAQALHPQGPLGAARAASTMARLTPALGTEAEQLRTALQEIAAARGVTAAGTGTLETGLAALGEARAELVAAMSTSGTPAEVGVSPDLTLLARDSETLTQLAAALAQAGGAPPPPAASDAGGAPLLWPVRGSVARKFDEPDAAGVRRPGVVLSAPPLALVRAPADAMVRYAGPFLEYGYVLVLEPEPETMVVLAGLAQVQVHTGEPVRRGAPLGLLGGRALDAEEFVMLPLADTGAGGSETLYIEVRRGRGPVDPEPLFAEAK